mmetsp:Transcript_14792/g.37542  ORF Transcript_14792/g.37542 Transcript_14792/m.37542 type:complete len:113 (+) Transcript_14792:437-775(+)
MCCLFPQIRTFYPATLCLVQAYAPPTPAELMEFGAPMSLITPASDIGISLRKASKAASLALDDFAALKVDWSKNTSTPPLIGSTKVGPALVNTDSATPPEVSSPKSGSSRFD